ncbi:MAG: Ig-like domain-containing protein [Lachnospiraceae bacterium]
MQRMDRKWKKAISLWLVILFLCSVCTQPFAIQGHAASVETVDLRFVFTSDLHGQLSAYDYQTGKAYPRGGLSKAYTLMKKAIAEKGKANCLKFDIGDVLYDYTTEFIMSDQDAVQPIYQAMNAIGYDAITLGNHDFDYGYDYITGQMKNSSLASKVVLSNVVDSMTKKPIYNETMMFTKRLKTTRGRTVSVKIGVIGETIPNLSNKTDDYTGILDAQDMVKDAEEKSAALKRAGADVVVVLAHSGIGPEKPQEYYKNVSYRLTSVPDVDVVLCGHSHTSFPSDERASADYYQLSGVNKKTGLVNGKLLVSAKDRGQAIGVADITLSVSASGSKSIYRQSGEVRNVKKTTEEKKRIANFMKDWKKKLTSACETQYAAMAEGEEMNNFFGMIEDNAISQLVNDAKIAYAKHWIYNNRKQDMDIPVVGVAQYAKYGDNSVRDFSNVQGEINGGTLSDFQNYNNNTNIYQVKVKQLREWMEWSASAYMTIEGDSTWTDQDMITVMGSSDLDPLLYENWLDDWGCFAIFDGVEYTIDLTVKPRYNRTGNQVRDTHRIRTLTINGTELQDEDTLFLVTNRITKVYEALQGIEEQSIKGGRVKSQGIVGDYLKSLSKQGGIVPYEDQNWHFLTPADYSFIYKAPKKGRSQAQKKEWYVSLLDEMGSYDYYKAQVPEHKDTTGPNIVLSSSNTAKTNQKIAITVQAHDESGIRYLRYSNIKGQAALGAAVTKGYFEVSMNGTYYVTAEDGAGNITTKAIVVDNIDQNLLQAPKLKTYTNRKGYITGQAEPLATVYIETEDGNYETKVDAVGNFQLALDNPVSGTMISAYVQDARGRVSDVVTAKVERTGPNQPRVNALSNTDGSITGTIRDTDSMIYAVVGSKVYVSEDGGTKAYKNSEKYNEKKTIVPTKITQKDGEYKITVPGVNANKKVLIYGIDHLGRTSRSISTVASEDGPNPPSIYTVLSGLDHVRGKVTYLPGASSYDVTVSVDGVEYTGKTDSKGYYDIPVDPMVEDEQVKVYLTDLKEGQQRRSYVAQMAVPDMATYIDDNLNDFVEFGTITNKVSTIEGTSEVRKRVYLYYDDEIITPDFDSEGNFTIERESMLDPEQSICMLSFSLHGKVEKGSVIFVEKEVPAKPQLLTEDFSNAQSEIRLATDEQCEMVVKAEGVSYISEASEYNEEENRYEYVVSIGKHPSSTELKIYARNEVGNSKILKASVAWSVPDAPNVQPLTTASKAVKGSLSLPEDIDISYEDFVVYVKIKQDVYTADITEDGTFKVKIPKQKKGTVVKVYAETAEGSGLTTKLKVKKK